MKEPTTSTPSLSASESRASQLTSSGAAVAFEAAERGTPLALYAVTIFLSAFLLFEVEPIIAKIVLPWFGGSAAVWTTCLLFFQAVLLAGYLYAHVAMRRLAPRTQVWVHIGLLAVSLLALPVIPSDGWKPMGNEDPSWRILGLLAVTLGLPYLLLSATSPMLQAWYARSHESALPYRLFALSNPLTQNVASIPFLWLLPLARYLLSFIFCFEGRGWYHRATFLKHAAVALGGMAYAMGEDFQ